jgi:ribosomal protein S18 acetylase RimI-like enzyme
LTLGGDNHGGSSNSGAIILRPAKPMDATALADLGRDSFCAAFAHLYRKQDLDQFLAEAYAEEVVASEIADDAYIHCLATDGNRLLGYCKMQHPSPYSSHSGAANPISLNQLYTQPDMTGKGLGATLMDWAIDEARSRLCDAILLSVWSENFGAQRFYERFGFTKIADIEFWVGSHRDDEFLFELMLELQERQND